MLWGKRQRGQLLFFQLVATTMQLQQNTCPQLSSTGRFALLMQMRHVGSLMSSSLILVSMRDSSIAAKSLEKRRKPRAYLAFLLASMV